MLKGLSWRALFLVSYSVARDVFLIFHPHSNVLFLQGKWGKCFTKLWLSLPYPNSITALSDLSPFTEFFQSLFLDFLSYVHSLGPQILGSVSSRFWHLFRHRTSGPEHSFTWLLVVCVLPRFGVCVDLSVFVFQVWVWLQRNILLCLQPHRSHRERNVWITPSWGVQEEKVYIDRRWKTNYG